MGHAPWWDPEMMAHRGGNHGCPDEGADAPISAWAADESRKALGQELSEVEEKLQGGLVRTAQGR